MLAWEILRQIKWKLVMKHCWWTCLLLNPPLLKKIKKTRLNWFSWAASSYTQECSNYSGLLYWFHAIEGTFLSIKAKYFFISLNERGVHFCTLSYPSVRLKNYLSCPIARFHFFLNFKASSLFMNFIGKRIQCILKCTMQYY